MLELTEDAVFHPVPDHVPPELVYPSAQVFAKDFDVDPWAVYRQVRDEAPPIFFSPVSMIGKGMWYATRLEDVRTIFQDYSRFTTSFNYTVGGDIASRMLPLEVDPPEHNKYRSLLTPLFAPKSIDRLEVSIRATCDALLDEIYDRGACDFVHDFARTLPGTVFMQLMGLPMERREQFFRWEETFFHGDTAEERRATGKAIGEQPRGAHHAAAPGTERRPDVDAARPALRRRLPDPARGPDGHVLAAVHRRARHGARRPRSLVPLPGRASRPAGPTRRRPLEGPVRGRGAAAVARLGQPRPDRPRGLRVQRRGAQEGRQINALVVTADRDPAEFPEPEAVRLDRQRTIHFTFGGGPHRCVGSHLARRELGIAISAWIDRIPDFRITPGNEDELRYATLGMFYLPRLPLSWTPARA